MMLDNYIPLILPIVWAIVATIVALTLYRTSQAVFEQEDIRETSRRKLRLVGSVVIAALVFWGLAHYTPMENYSKLDKGQVRIDRALLLAHQIRVRDLNVSNEDLFGCASITAVRECSSHLDELRTRSKELQESADDLYKP